MGYHFDKDQPLVSSPVILLQMRKFSITQAAYIYLALSLLMTGGKHALLKKKEKRKRAA